tara:strand:- start:32342 stop:33823 length:1482 start_codon:yes stop_codon:yes gene_type:complete
MSKKKTFDLENSDYPYLASAIKALQKHKWWEIMKLPSVDKMMQLVGPDEMNVLNQRFKPPKAPGTIYPTRDRIPNRLAPAYIFVPPPPDFEPSLLGVAELAERLMQLWNDEGKYSSMTQSEVNAMLVQIDDKYYKLYSKVERTNQAKLDVETRGRNDKATVSKLEATVKLANVLKESIDRPSNEDAGAIPNPQITEARAEAGRNLTRVQEAERNLTSGRRVVVGGTGNAQTKPSVELAATQEKLANELTRTLTKLIQASELRADNTESNKSSKTSKSSKSPDLELASNRIQSLIAGAIVASASTAANAIGLSAATIGKDVGIGELMDHGDSAELKNIAAVYIKYLTEIIKLSNPKVGELINEFFTALQKLSTQAVTGTVGVGTNIIKAAISAVPFIGPLVLLATSFSPAFKSGAEAIMIQRRASAALGMQMEQLREIVKAQTVKLETKIAEINLDSMENPNKVTVNTPEATKKNLGIMNIAGERALKHEEEPD